MLTILCGIFPCSIILILILSANKKGRKIMIDFNNYIETKNTTLGFIITLAFYGSLMLCMYNALF